MINKKTILIVTDYFIGEPNSVSDILNNLYNFFKDKFIIYFLTSDIQKNDKIKYKRNGQYKCFISTKRSKFLFNRISIPIFNWLGLFTSIYYFKKIRKKIKYDLIIYLVYDPNYLYLDIYNKYHDPYIVILYDTFIKRPYLCVDECKSLERKFISNSLSYFVPDWFYEDYISIYHLKNIKKIYLPLLNKKNYINLVSNPSDVVELGYFGQIQDFRNLKKIKQILEESSLKLFVHTCSEITFDKSIINAMPLVGKKLYQSLNSTKILVIFDNSMPYCHYLPSKVILYMSLGKPIIVFTDNKISILRKYLDNYPKKIYIDINNPNILRLKEFIKKNKINNPDLELGRSLTEKYYYDNSLVELNDLIETNFKNNK